MLETSKHKIVCKICGKIFIAGSLHYKYCSKACRKEANRLQMAEKRKSEQYREEEKKVRQKRTATEPYKYHSKLARDERLAQGKCAVCERPLYKESTYYCDYHMNYLRNRQNFRFERTCIICGKVFPWEGHNTKYCSAECQQEGRRLHAEKYKNIRKEKGTNTLIIEDSFAGGTKAIYIRNGTYQLVVKVNKEEEVISSYPSLGMENLVKVLDEYRQLLPR